MSNPKVQVIRHRRQLIVLGVACLVVIFAVSFWLAQYNQNLAVSATPTVSPANNANIAPVSNQPNVVNNTNTAVVNLTVKVLAKATKNTFGDITAYQFNSTNSLNVMPVSYESIVFNETPITKHQAVTIGTTPAQLLTITSAKDGSDQTMVEVKSAKQIFVFRGDDTFLHSLNQYVEFTNS